MCKASLLSNFNTTFASARMTIWSQHRERKEKTMQKNGIYYFKKELFLPLKLPLLLSISSWVTRDHFLQHIFNTTNAAGFILETLSRDEGDLTKKTNFIVLLQSHLCLPLPKGPVPPAKYFGFHKSKKMIPHYKHHPETLWNEKGLNTGHVIVSFWDHVTSVPNTAVLLGFFGPLSSISECITAD